MKFLTSVEKIKRKDSTTTMGFHAGEDCIKYGFADGEFAYLVIDRSYSQPIMNCRSDKQELLEYTKIEAISNMDDLIAYLDSNSFDYEIMHADMEFNNIDDDDNVLTISAIMEQEAAANALDPVERYKSLEPYLNPDIDEDDLDDDDTLSMVDRASSLMKYE